MEVILYYTMDKIKRLLPGTIYNQYRKSLKLMNGNYEGIDRYYKEDGSKSREVVYKDNVEVSTTDYENDKPVSPVPKKTGFVGYWKKNGTTYSKALHITKDQNLYNVEQIISDNSLITANNLTVSNNRLHTRYGDFEYVEGNDILLNRSVSNGTAFTRISKKDWDYMLDHRFE